MIFFCVSCNKRNKKHVFLRKKNKLTQKFCDVKCVRLNVSPKSDNGRESWNFFCGEKESDHLFLYLSIIYLLSIRQKVIGGAINTQPYLYNILILRLCECWICTGGERIYAYEEMSDRAPLWAYFYVYIVGVKVLTRCLNSCKDSKQHFIGILLLLRTCDVCIVHFNNLSRNCDSFLLFAHCFPFRAILDWCNCVVNSKSWRAYEEFCVFFYILLAYLMNKLLFQVLYIDDIENWIMRFV